MAKHLSFPVFHLNSSVLPLRCSLAPRTKNNPAGVIILLLLFSIAIPGCGPAVTPSPSLGRRIGDLARQP